MRRTSHLIFVVSMCLFIIGCGPKVELPPLPEIPTSELLTDVANQLDGARAAVDKKPRSHESNGNYGLVLATYSIDDAADIAFERARLLSPESARWAFYHSFVLRRKGDFDRAMQAINAGLEIRPNHVDMLVKRGELYFDLAELESAEKDLQAALEQNSTYPLAQFYVGRIHMTRGEFTKATDRFEKMLRDGIKVNDVYFQLSTAYRALGEQEKAAENLAKSKSSSNLKIVGYDPVIMQFDKLNVGDQPHVLRAGELYRKGRVQQAIEELEQAHAKNPNNVGTHVHLVRFYGHVGNLEKAEEHYAKANELDPNFNQLHSNMGFAYQYAKRPEQAAAAYGIAAKNDPDNPGVLAELGYALSQSNRVEEAIGHFERSLELHPENRDLRFILAQNFVKLRRYPDAIKMFETAMTPRDQKTIAIKRSLARTHAISGNPQEAITVLEDAIALAKDYGSEPMVADLVADLERVRYAARKD